MSTIRAVTYSRYSSDQQRESSITDQQRNTRARAQAEGWPVVADFADRAISGSDNARPQYVAMQAAAARREFEVLLLDDLSRLTRDSVEQETTIRRLEFQGIRIISTSDGYDSQSKARKVHRAVKGMMNELFLDDLAERVHRGQKGQALQGRWCGGKPYGYRLRPILDPAQRDQYGEPLQVGTRLEVDPVQAAIVRELYAKYIDGASCLTIARDLNARAVPSPGSTWKRRTRRCSGWLGNAVYGILKNDLYTGRQRWNTSRFVRDPDTGRTLRRARPESEWVTHADDALRIITDEQFQRAQARTRSRADGNVALKSGGKAKYLLSGLMVCDTCKAHYVMGDARSYTCSSFWNGRACSNDERVRRDHIQDVILGPVLQGLRDPASVAKFARSIEAGFTRRLEARAARADAAPKDLQDLDARIARLRARLAAGDPDMAADELQAAIARAQAKRDELAAAQPAVKQSARIMSMLPKAAGMYLQQIEAALAGDSRAAGKARVFLRDMLGTINMIPGPAKGELRASYRLNPAALIRGAGTAGRGDRI